MADVELTHSGRGGGGHAGRAAVGRRADGRRDHRRGPQLRRRVRRRHGPGHRATPSSWPWAGSSSWRRRAAGADASTPIQPALEGAYELGRGEARSGRSMDALLAAYRVGARVSWRHMSASAVRAGLTAEQLARFAELVFAYIDQLSASSVAGHSDELATSGRVRERYLERLADLLLAGSPPDDLAAAAERAGWAPPRTLTAVILPEAKVRGALVYPRSAHAAVGHRRARRAGPGRAGGAARARTPSGRSRPALMRSLDGRDAVVGPARPWTDGAEFLRARLPGAAARADRRRPVRWTPSDGSPTWCSERTPRRSPTCGRRCSRRSTTSVPPPARS